MGALAFALAGCGALSFDVAQDIPEQNVPGNPLGGLLPASLFQVPMNIDVAQHTKSMGTGPASSARLKSVTFTITAPAGGKFDFLDSITIRITAQGLADQEIARLAPVPAQGTISLDVIPGVDLLPYINAGATINATAAGRTPTQNTSYNGRVVVTVNI